MARQCLFKAIPDLLEVCRYGELNPVRARMVKKPEALAWSSYRAHVGLEQKARPDPMTPSWVCPSSNR